MHSKASVLIVDDEQFIRQILARIVQREGYVIGEASGGKDALEKLEQTKFDFVISDIRMPNMDGMELLTKVKTRFPETMVILITAYAGEYKAEDALTAGADHYITKPFKNVEIARTLDRLYQRREMAKAKKHKNTPVKT
ncbi:MAG: response regulator [candidate division Zixibacteria bacterium]|nr:response regulator [candidate division Zixibacteria bacterium]